ncbi:transcriptional regulator LeuO [Xenorhabdus sp. PB61.4]|uniref:HTH-type transcriptional regulator LeuO n=1 Tax=Xenorhabdus stockiae TaxID=351614 RepID=A0A2D0KNZ8_9GAMM|nr:MULTISPECIES: transcriptional regulator LeuO [Xenorhabdus]MCC8366706.1 transcriptional regulator LeuO [Xenorhabdus sp. PB61.4]MCC8381924.1 transcriptional regulator LeuO [Xenorhabdus sp. PB30.3]PHM65161.1 HTH-type transcriptional regulator LeuO [Xenorhabdus stockiae]PHM70099.1 HTH-type transcriptional regulator LeuO [Xenorhabdus sp. KJ12.1]
MAGCNLVNTGKKEPCEVQLRSVDLNLLTVFDAVMQMQNITRAAQALGMSQPAVSNAVARLKTMFDDELFVRHGRGIQPTARAKQLFGPLRQALQIVHNELPGAGFDPDNSVRTFNLSICSPLDIRLAAQIVGEIKRHSPNIDVVIKTQINDNIEKKLKYQEIEFVISYTQFEHPDFQHFPLFDDELVLAVSQSHPRIGECISQQQLQDERHAIVALDNSDSFSKPYYENSELIDSVSYQGTDLNSVLNIVSQTYLVAIAPKWMVEHYSGQLNIRTVSLPNNSVSRPCYLIWHASMNRDKGHQWMKSLLSCLGDR